MTAFIRGIRTPLSTTMIPASARIASNAARYFPSRSRIRYFTGRPALSRSMNRVPGRLGHPRCGGVGGSAEDPYPAGGVFDDRQDVRSGAGQRRCLEEIGGDDGVGLGAQERRPGGAGALGCRVDTGVVEDLPHRGGGDRDTEDE
jgi:hypothetical protein